MKILGIIIKLVLSIGFTFIQRESVRSVSELLLMCLAVYTFLSYYAIMYSICNEQDSHKDTRIRVSLIGFIFGEIFTRLILPLLFCLIPLLIADKVITWILPGKFGDVVRAVMMLIILVYPFIRDVRCVIEFFKSKQDGCFEDSSFGEIPASEVQEKKETVLEEK